MLFLILSLISDVVLCVCESSFNINIPLDEEAGDAQKWIKTGAAAILESL